MNYGKSTGSNCNFLLSFINGLSEMPQWPSTYSSTTPFASNFRSLQFLQRKSNGLKLNEGDFELSQGSKV